MAVTVDEFKKIKTRIDELKEEKARAKGQMDSIEKSWKEEYGIETIDEAASKANEMDNEIETAEKRLDALIGQIKESVNFEDQ